MALIEASRVRRWAQWPAADVRPEPQEPPALAEEADALQLTLDGRELSVAGRVWRVEVFSVAEISSRRYVQVALRGPVDHFVTLRMNRGLSAGPALHALLAWLAHPTSAGTIIDVE